MFTNYIYSTATVSDIATLTVLGKSIIKASCRLCEATQMTNFITLYSAYEKNFDLIIRNKLKTSLYTIL